MLAPSASHLSASMAGTSSGGAGAALAGAAFSATALTPPNPKQASGGSCAVCLSFMRHSIATHNEAAAASADAMGSVYLSEAYADSR